MGVDLVQLECAGEGVTFLQFPLMGAITNVDQFQYFYDGYRCYEVYQNIVFDFYWFRDHNRIDVVV